MSDTAEMPTGLASDGLGPVRKARSALLEPLDLPRAQEPQPDLPDDRFLNREKSWLDFNARVLALAEDPQTPLLERAKFLAIFASNLDEFYMVRVAGLKRRQAARLPLRTADGLNVAEQLQVISDTRRRARRPAGGVLPRPRARPRCSGRASGSMPGRTWQPGSAPGCTPTSGSRSSRSSHRSPSTRPTRSRTSAGCRSTSRCPCRTPTPGSSASPGSRSRRTCRVSFRSAEGRWLPLEDLVAAHLPQLFPGMEVVDAHVFRVTRNADLEVEEDEAEDLLQALERELARRRFGPAVRLEVQDDIDADLLDLLVRELEVDRRDVVRVRGLVDLSSLWAFYDLDRPELRDPPHVTKPHPRLGTGDEGRDYFAVLRDGDVLVHHPYDSFTTSVQRFLEQAAADPHVLAIKQTLYRTSGDSPMIEALIDAAEAGKQVVVLVEIKARFDETANIKWARALERAGCHVVYGLVGLKTHCKTLLVVRQEKDHIRRYCHLGTGNYNPKTARMYEDVGILTADPDVGADLTDLFNVLTGYSRQTSYRSLLVAPEHLRQGIIERIEAETAAARDGRPAGIRLKANSLVDELVIDALYRASRAGVPDRLPHPRHLRAASRRPRAQRDGPCPLGARALPGAQPHLPVPGAGRVLDRQRGHDAPQSRPAGGDPRPGQGAGVAGAAEQRPGSRLLGGHPGLGAAVGQHVAPPRRGPAGLPGRAGPARSRPQ